MSLHSRLVADGPLPAADLHGVAVGVASALAAIHAAGLVHRDLKPANVMLTLSGCRVIDFGIARSQDPAGPAAAASGKVLGTPGWIAPEVLIGGPATPAADVFAWGCLIAHAGTGRMPIGGDPATLRTGADEPDLSGLPEPLVPAVRSALAKNPAERPTASDLLLTLVEQQEPAPFRAVARDPAAGFSGARPLPGVRASRPPSRRRSRRHRHQGVHTARHGGRDVVDPRPGAGRRGRRRGHRADRRDHLRAGAGQERAAAASRHPGAQGPPRPLVTAPPRFSSGEVRCAR